MVAFPWPCLMTKGRPGSVEPIQHRRYSWGTQGSISVLVQLDESLSQLLPETSKLVAANLGRKSESVDHRCQNFLGVPLPTSKNYASLIIIVSFPRVFLQRGTWEPRRLWYGKGVPWNGNGFSPKKQSWNIAFGVRSEIAGIWFIDYIRGPYYTNSEIGISSPLEAH